jgi:hypothetical protein
MNKYAGVFFVTVLLYIFYIYSKSNVEGFFGGGHHGGGGRHNTWGGGGSYYGGRGGVFYNPPRYSDWYYPNYWEYRNPVVTEVIREKPRVPDYKPFVL